MTTAKEATLTFLLRYFAVLLLMIIGSAVFYGIENSGVEKEKIQIEKEMKENVATMLKLKDKLSQGLNTTVNSTLFNEIAVELQKLKNREIPEKWDFSTGLHFTFTIVSTVGYGVIVPKTNGGKVMSILYAIIGIPVFLYALAAAGTFKKKCIEKLLYLVEIKLLKKEEITKLHSKVLSLTIFLFFVEMFIFSAAISQNQKTWSYLDCIYYWFITASTIGFGDYVLSAEGNNKVNPGLMLGVLMVCLILQSGLATIFETLQEILEKRDKQEKKCRMKICTCFSTETKNVDPPQKAEENSTYSIEKLS